MQFKKILVSFLAAVFCFSQAGIGCAEGMTTEQNDVADQLVLVQGGTFDMGRMKGSGRPMKHVIKSRCPPSTSIHMR